MNFNSISLCGVKMNFLESLNEDTKTNYLESLEEFSEDRIVAEPSGDYEVLDYLVEYIREGEIDYNIFELLCGSFKPTPKRGKSVIDEIENRNNDDEEGDEEGDEVNDTKEEYLPWGADWPDYKDWYNETFSIEASNVLTTADNHINLLCCPPEGECVLNLLRSLEWFIDDPMNFDRDEESSYKIWLKLRVKFLWARLRFHVKVKALQDICDFWEHLIHKLDEHERVPKRLRGEYDSNFFMKGVH